MPRTAANIPANETKSQRFVRLCNSRMATISNNLKSLGSLGKTDQYESKPEQRQKIEKALTEWTKRAIDQLNRGGEETPEFKL